MTTPFTRDTDTLGEDGPQLTQFEGDTARQSEAPEQINGGAQPDTAPSNRPQFSPVAQPGQVSEIHWHTVKSEQREPGGETTGMIGRFHERPAAQQRPALRVPGRKGRRHRG